MQISLLLLLSLSSVALASPAPGHRHAHSAAPHKRHAAAAGHNAPRALNSTLVSPKRRATSKRCARRASSSSLAPASTSTSAATKTQAPVGVGINPTAAAPTSSASSSSSEKPESTPTKSNPPSNGNGAVGAPFKPENWPTKTQAAATYAATRATTADPLLLGVSEALNNANNEFFTQTHKGDLTYYGQGLVACGDTYDDSTYTAAVSHLMYDAWPGTTAETNRSPICGPYVPGRQTINAVTGLFQSAAKSSVGSIMIGGDGLPNCDPAAGKQCHIPLTATVTNPANGKSVIVKIVDRCEGCALHDIDMTPTAYKAIADPDLGRVPGIEWHFNRF